MHNPESVRENETQKILWDFEIKTFNLRSPKQSNLEIAKKEKKKKKRKKKENKKEKENLPNS